MNSVRSSRGVQPGHSILTAIVVGSAVFSAMTLPLLMQKPVPILMDFPPQWSESSPAQMDRETRNSIIRYMGIAIVASVGTGMGAVEILRRQYRAKQRLQNAEAEFQQELLTESTPESTIESTLESGYKSFVAAAIESRSSLPESNPLDNVAAEELPLPQSIAYSLEVPAGLALES
ncbi:hypothetical protein [Leptolyngbya ohadii]|uniref:hypothetical protein n=1 Tax=Leptolyngbya ohadii TaxID=1962290 RepID=UPI00117B36DA|nr:hypothetical protein [Leptolyngbya ohadii]